MCGIVGIYNYGRAAPPVSLDLLHRLNATLAHRGPDDLGTWVSSSFDVGFAHRRLSIIDITVAARQPLHNEDSSVWITFNGEIYNYERLRSHLLAQGSHSLTTTSDTEVIVHLYEELGEDCLALLDGMFAFGIWDDRRKRLLLARDRLGKKPLYYFNRNGLLVFASEIKAILEHPQVSRELDRESLDEYLTFRTVPAPRTLFEGIHKLPPGHLLTCNQRGEVVCKPYWDVTSLPATESNSVDKNRHNATPSERVLDLLRAAVRKRMVSDVPVGAFLSGGLDSTAIVALMTEAASAQLQTFSIAIKDIPDCSEIDEARFVSNHFGTNHHEVFIDRHDLEAVLPKLSFACDDPVADPVNVPLFFLSKLTRSHDVKVVQTGEGSDEIFFGYESRLQLIRSFLRKERFARFVPAPLIKAMALSFSGVAREGGRLARLGRVLQELTSGLPALGGTTGFARSRSLDVTTDGHSCRTRSLAANRTIDELADRIRKSWPDADVGAIVSYVDLKLRLAELLLMRTDKITMLHGVEARVPFMDHELVQYVLSIPLSTKLAGQGSKPLLKKALAGIVPDRVLNRRKQIFFAPVNLWLRNGMDSYVRNLFATSSIMSRGVLRKEVCERMLDLHIAGRADYGAELWTIITLCGWYDTWIERRSLSL